MLELNRSENTTEQKEEHEQQPDLIRRRLLFKTNEQVVASESRVEQPEQPLFTVIAGYIRSCSKRGEIVSYLSFRQSPFLVPLESLQTAVELLAEQADCQDIVTIKGARDRYYYSTISMATNYANTLVLLLEQDSCKVIAEAIRFECQVYPRPYKKQMLTYEPYYFSNQQIEAALTLMLHDPDYQDIQHVVASNDEPYLFSQRFMSYGQAKGLSEWFEVEQYQNP